LSETEGSNGPSGGAGLDAHNSLPDGAVAAPAGAHTTWKLSGQPPLLDTSVTYLHAALLVDDTDRTLYVTEYPGNHALLAGRVVGQNWRELFPEFDEVKIEAEGPPDTFFFISTGKERSAYRVRKWSAVPMPGADSGHFVTVEGIGDPTAVRELIYRERMIALGQIAHGVAHEINNPLTIISGWVQILLAQEDADQARRARLQLMSKEVGRITNIVRRLLSFGRRAPAEPQLIQVNRVVSDVLTLVEYQIRNENIRVVTDLAADLPPVMGDPNQLQQVFLNIIVNARQAMPNGGSLAITTAVAGDGSVEVALGDTGCGMTAELAQKIFDPFYTTKDKEGGSGVGLFLCRNIVKDHGGTLTVSSRPGEGSTFIVRLPGVPAEESSDRAAGGLGALCGGAGAGADAAGDVTVGPTGPR